MNNSKLNHQKELTANIIAISQKAAEEILKIYKSDFTVKYKNDLSPVTIADRISEEIIINEISKIEPGIDIISEESYSIKKIIPNSDYFFCIDPLDGTREFVKKNNEFSINIAIIYKTKPVLGIINIPAKEEVFYTSNCLDSFKINKNNLHQKIETRKSKLPSTMLHSWSKIPGKLREVIKQNNINKIIQCGSAIKFCLLSEGNADIYIRTDPCYEWDTAAGHAILNGSGGCLYDMNGNALKYNKTTDDHLNKDGFIALGNKVHKKLFPGL